MPHQTYMPRNTFGPKQDPRVPLHCRTLRCLYRTSVYRHPLRSNASLDFRHLDRILLRLVACCPVLRMRVSEHSPWWVSREDLAVFHSARRAPEDQNAGKGPARNRPQVFGSERPAVNRPLTIGVRTGRMPTVAGWVVAHKVLAQERVAQKERVAQMERVTQKERAAHGIHHRVRFFPASRAPGRRRVVSHSQNRGLLVAPADLLETYLCPVALCSCGCTLRVLRSGGACPPTAEYRPTTASRGPRPGALREVWRGTPARRRVRGPPAYPRSRVTTWI